MMTKIKTTAEIDAMRSSGRLLATVLNILKKELTVGMSTKDIAEIAKKELKGTGGTPTFLGQYGFPDVICISVNDEVVHGIPSESKIIKEGDIVSMDFGVTYEGMITDSAISVIAGKVINSQDARLVRDTEASLISGIMAARGGCKVGDIANAIEKSLDSSYGIVRDLVGHGVGHELHEEPNIPNQGNKGTGIMLEAGMTIAIEPMVNLGTFKVFTDMDGWTVKTTDGSRSAHFEHTILITDSEAEVLTQL